jgi:hypothetical protein
MSLFATVCYVFLGFGIASVLGLLLACSIYRTIQRMARGVRQADERALAGRSGRGRDNDQRMPR